MRTLTLTLLMLTASAVAQDDFGYLKKEDQKFFQNDANEGMNKLERIDSNVREINRLHGMIADLKAEVAALKKDVEELKKRK